MANQTCRTPNCGRPSPDGFICTSCTDQVRIDLGKLGGSAIRPGLTGHAPRADDSGLLPEPDRGLLADLATTMCRFDVSEGDSARPAEIDDGPPRHPTDEPIAAHPLPVNLGAGRVLAAAHADLHGWVRHLIETRYGSQLNQWVDDQRARDTGVHGPWRRAPQLPEDTAPELALWLARHVQSIRQDQAAGELADAVAKHRVLAERIVYPEALAYFGCCDHCRARTDGTEALVDLYASRDASLVTCPRCSAGWDAKERRRWLLEQGEEQRLSAADVSRALVDYVRDVRAGFGLPTRPMTAAAVRGMGERNRLTRYEPTKAELAAGTVTETRYRVKDVMGLVVALAEEDRARADRREQRGRRGPAAREPCRV